MVLVVQNQIIQKKNTEKLWVSVTAVDNISNGKTHKDSNYTLPIQMARKHNHQQHFFADPLPADSAIGFLMALAGSTPGSRKQKQRRHRQRKTTIVIAVIRSGKPRVEA